MLEKEMFPIRLQIFNEEGEGGEENLDENKNVEEKSKEVDIDLKLKEMEEKYEKAIKAKEVELEKQYTEKTSKLEKRLAQIEDLSLDTKKKEELSKIDEKDRELERELSYQKRLEDMENKLKEKEHESLIKTYVAKNPYLAGHIEHTKSKEDLDSLIKREGDNWKRLWSYENSNSKKNRNVTGGYNTQKIDNTASFNNKVKSWEEAIVKFLPKKRIAK